ncbi:hypothetical protein DY000_02037858 [Brassica cretica]|uniref:Uncharacterized protein n=1 Tax=Brassica cretica TaxID=69181 RepID=A0ABQ7BA80_BRACR|nr:hypothetical protein DY000_02037858 [Brassica cretica]
MSTGITFSSRRSFNNQTSVLKQHPAFKSASKINESVIPVVVVFDDDRLNRSFLSSSVMYGGPTSCNNTSDIQQECSLSHRIRRLAEEEDSKREMKKLSPVNYGASSEYDYFSSYSESSTHTLWLNYAYVTAELCIR